MRGPDQGEVIVGGRLVSGTGGENGRGVDTQAQPNEMRHLGLHVFTRSTDRMVPEAHVTISIAGNARRSRAVPIARMYGVEPGPDDMHYGNNVPLPPGAYTVSVSVNGEKARFNVTVAADF